jgi:hypothetical protein
MFVWIPDASAVAKMMALLEASPLPRRRGGVDNVAKHISANFAALELGLSSAVVDDTLRHRGF